MCLGIPAQIIAIDPEQHQTATVDVAGIKRDVNIACVLDDNTDPAQLINSWVLVHVGFAMSKIDEQEARQTLELLDQLGEIDEELQVMQAQQTGIAT